MYETGWLEARAIINHILQYPRLLQVKILFPVVRKHWRNVYWLNMRNLTSQTNGMSCKMNCKLKKQCIAKFLIARLLWQRNPSSSGEGLKTKLSNHGKIMLTAIFLISLTIAATSTCVCAAVSQDWAGVRKVSSTILSSSCATSRRMSLVGKSDEGGGG